MSSLQTGPRREDDWVVAGKRRRISAEYVALVEKDTEDGDIEGCACANHLVSRGDSG